MLEGGPLDGQGRQRQGRQGYGVAVTLADQALLPPALWVWTWNSYVVPVVSPLTVTLVPVCQPVAVQPPDPLILYCTWYSVAPDTAVHVRGTWVTCDDVAARPVGVAGAAGIDVVPGSTGNRRLVPDVASPTRPSVFWPQQKIDPPVAAVVTAQVWF